METKKQEEENFDFPKSITFDYEAQANLPQHIKDRMKADRENAEKKAIARESQRKEVLKHYSYWCKGNKPNNLSEAINSIDFAIYHANQQTTSQQQTIERLREMVKKLSDKLENYGQVWGYDEQKLVGEAEQIFNTTEPIDQ